MPVYEYKCKACGRDFEYQQRISDPDKTTCEVCGGALDRLISRTAFSLKGSGWYKDLYASPKPEAQKSDSADKSAESKSDAKADKSAAKSDGKGDAPAASDKPSTKSSDSGSSSGSSSTGGGGGGSSGSTGSGSSGSVAKAS